MVGSLADRWEAMDEAGLREELFMWFRMNGQNNMMWFTRQRELEDKISEQRKQIKKLLADKASLAKRLESQR